jgi:hypothetical protein
MPVHADDANMKLGAERRFQIKGPIKLCKIKPNLERLDFVDDDDESNQKRQDWDVCAKLVFSPNPNESSRIRILAVEGISEHLNVLELFHAHWWKMCHLPEEVRDWNAKLGTVLRFEICESDSDRLPAVRAIRVNNTTAPGGWRKVGEALGKFLEKANKCDSLLKPPKPQYISKKRQRSSMEMPEAEVAVLAKFEFGVEKINGENISPSLKFLHEGDHEALQKNARNLTEVVKKALNEWFFFLMSFYPSLLLYFCPSPRPFRPPSFLPAFSMCICENDF